MNIERFEVDLLDLMDRHDISQVVVVLRDGSDLRIRCCASTEVDTAGVKKMGDIINKAVLDGAEEVNAAMLAAEKGAKK